MTSFQVLKTGKMRMSRLPAVTQHKARWLRLRLCSVRGISVIHTSRSSFVQNRNLRLILRLCSRLPFMCFGDFVDVWLLSGHFLHERLQGKILLYKQIIKRCWCDCFYLQFGSTWCSAMRVLISSISWGRGSLSLSFRLVSAHCSQVRRFSRRSWVANRSVRAVASRCWCCRAQACTCNSSMMDIFIMMWIFWILDKPV